MARRSTASKWRTAASAPTTRFIYRMITSRTRFTSALVVRQNLARKARRRPLSKLPRLIPPTKWCDRVLLRDDLLHWSSFSMPDMQHMDSGPFDREQDSIDVRL